MASERLALELALNPQTFGHISSGLVPQRAQSTSYDNPKEQEWENFFELMFDEYYGGTSTNASNHHSAALAQIHPPPTTEDASTTVETNAPTPSTSSTSTQVLAPVLPAVDEQNQNISFQEEPTQNQNDATLDED